MEFKVSGVVIGSSDYKEKDKIITIFTLELGVLRAVLKGVKAANAKLKFASQTFCFANFILTKKGEFYTVTAADQIESFYDLTSDYNKFMVGQVVLETITAVMLPQFISEPMFLQTLKALKMLAFYDIEPSVVCVKFFLSTLYLTGYNLDFKKCNECKSALISEIYFNYDLGFFTCKICAGNYHTPISTKQFNLLRIINNTDYEQLITIKVAPHELYESIIILAKNLENKFNKKLKSIKQFILN